MRQRFSSRFENKVCAAMIAATVILAANLHAAEQQFAIQLPTPKANEQAGPYYALRLPQTIYSRSNDSQLSDLRLRNAKGDYLAYAWSDFSIDSIQTNQQIDTQVLPIFPVYANPIGDKNNDALEVDFNLQLKRLNDGSLQAKIQSSESIGNKRRAKEQAPIAWIVDASQIVSSKALLQAKLHIDDKFEGIAAVQIQASDDLQHWRNITARAQVVQLKHASEQIQQNQIALANTQAKYLRLVWEQAASAPHLLQFEAISQEHAKVAPALEWSHSITADKCDANSCEYQIPKNTPVDSLRIRLQEKNTLASLQIYGQVAGSNEAYNRHHHFRNPLYALHAIRHQKQMIAANQAHEVFLGTSNAYRLAMAQGEVETEDFALNGYPYQRIRLHISTGMRQLGNAAPTINIGSMTSSLVFLARGEAPFFLEVGGDTNEGKAQSMTRLMPQTHIRNLPLVFAELTLPKLDIEPAAASASNMAQRNPIGSEHATKNVQKSYLLWAVLGLALCIIAVMVWSLLRKIDADNKDRPSS